jgi:hypothetical protein
MKLIIIISILLISTVAWAQAPYLRCDPYPVTVTQPSDFSIQYVNNLTDRVPIIPEILSPAFVLPDNSVNIRYPVGDVAYGAHYMLVKAVLFDPFAPGGRLESSAVPFSFIKRDFGLIILIAPSGMYFTPN